MSNPVISTKFGIPPPPASYLPRPRLDARWPDWRTKRLVLVTAGAGFGKTSFLAAGARGSERPVAWYALDEWDAELSSFCAHLLAALRAEDPPDEGEADIAQVASPDRALAAVVRALRANEQGGLLILDDVHLVAGSAEILRFLARLVRFLPEGCTLVLSSREHVDVATMRLRSLGTMDTLESADLSFSAEELAALFQERFAGAELAPSHARRITTLTEGWAAGIEIFFQVLAGSSPEQIDEGLARFQDAGSGWFAYFAEEVLSRLDPDTQDFLRRSSALPQLDADLCDELLGIDSSRRTLKSLARRNLFTFASADGRSFRYHHLFRDFLRSQLALAETGTGLAKFRRRVARALRDRGEWAEAAEAYAAASDPEATLRLFDKLGEELLATGQYTAITRALDSIPAASLRGHPGALFVRGRIHDIQGRWDDAEVAYRRALRIDSKGPRQVELISLLAQLRMRKGDYRACLKLCDQALAAPGKMRAEIRGRILGLRGVSACDLGRLSEGEDFLKQAGAVFRRRKDSVGEGRVLYLLAANVYVPRGDFREAKSAARRSLVIFRRLRDPRRICHSLGVLGWVMQVAGEFREARELTDEGLRMAESLEYGTMLGICHYTLGQCDLHDGDLQAAREHFERARELGEKLGEAELLSIPYMGLAEFALKSGNRHAARKQASHALAVVREMKDLLLEARCRTILGLAEAETRRRKAAEHWAAAERILRKIGSVHHLHHLLLIRLDAEKLKEEQGRELMTELLEGVAGREGEKLFLAVDPERASRVLPRALAWGIEVEYVSRLLVQLGQEALPLLRPLALSDDENLRMHAVEILAQIGGEEARMLLTRVASGAKLDAGSARKAAEELEQIPGAPLEIRALGPLCVSLPGRELRFEQWKSRRALRLFQLLLVHRFRWVPQDVALEALWPDADPRKAKVNLRQSIYLLRKVLEPGLEEARLSRYVRYRNEACRLEPGEGHSYDVAEFEELLRQVDVHWNAGERSKAKPQLREALLRYGGDFLAESPYEELAVLEREQLRDRCLRSLHRLLDIHAEEEGWEEQPALCRRGLALDPYSEEIYWHLVHAQFRLGHRHEALADFHRYEEMMIREMDLLSSARMKALAEKVLALGGD